LSSGKRLSIGDIGSFPVVDLAHAVEEKLGLVTEYLAGFQRDVGELPFPLLLIPIRFTEPVTELGVRV